MTNSTEIRKHSSEYLEGSTIHGLNHIVNTKRFIRAGWIVIVVLGFIIAGFLIHWVAKRIEH